MKKFVAFVIVCGFAVAMVACGGKKEEAAAAVDSVATSVMDSAVQAMDSTMDAVADSVK